jgi:hypothetical protein
MWNLVLGDKTRHYTPLSDHLADLFREWSKSFAGLSPEFDLLFDQFELLASLAHLEQREAIDIEAEMKRGRGWASMPVGRVSWNSSNAERLFSDLQIEPTKQALLDAGFAKGRMEFLQLFFDYLGQSRTR